MPAEPIAAVILAAGMGTRMKSDRPKVMHAVAGRPMVGHVLDTVRRLDAERIAVVVGPGMDDVAAVAAPASTVEQTVRDGTAGAAKVAREVLAGFSGTVLILYGDTPLMTEDTIQRMLAARQATLTPTVVVLGFRPADPALYGRLITQPDGTLDAIVEARDATPEQLQIDLCNSGVMAVDGAQLFELLDKVDNKNAKQEYYLTDIVGLAREAGGRCVVVEGDEEELLGVDSRADLAMAEAIAQRRLREHAMAEGVTMLDPNTVRLSHDTKLGRDILIEPNVFFGPDVTVEDGAVIKSFSHLEKARVGAGAAVGPFARLRPGTVVGDNARVGNFVEVKNSVLEAGVKAGHLSYLGDAHIGAEANIGAGTITCNFDGFDKHKTEIGSGAFIGSNTALVAPVTVGDRAIIGAGSAVSEDVEADALVLTRARQTNKPGWAKDFRARKHNAKKEG